MNYSSEIINRAYDELQKRRDFSLALHYSRVDEIKEKYPEIYSVYIKITSTKDRLADVILSGRPDARAEINRIRDENLGLQNKLKSLLVSFGMPEDYLNIRYFCNLCSDTGIRNGNRCVCVTELLEKYAVEDMNSKCSIPLKNFADFNLSFYPESYSYGGKTYSPREIMEDNLKYCLDYAKRFPKDCPSVFMLGPTGLGKTFLSGCIASELGKNGFTVAFDTAQNYFREIEKEHFGRSDGDTLGTLMNADLVILDDLGSEFKSEFNTTAAYNILGSRLNMDRPTIVSSNMSIDELQKRYGDRIISRLTGMFKTLRFIGEDIRQIKRKQGIYQ